MYKLGDHVFVSNTDVLKNSKNPPVMKGIIIGTYIGPLFDKVHIAFDDDYDGSIKIVPDANDDMTTLVHNHVSYIGKPGLWIDRKYVKGYANESATYASVGARCSRCKEHNNYQSQAFICYLCKENPYR